MVANLVIRSIISYARYATKALLVRSSERTESSMPSGSIPRRMAGHSPIVNVKVLTTNGLCAKCLDPKRFEMERTSRCC